jgi:5-formyltetrahydrofolate cyclo-ligase
VNKSELRSKYKALRSTLSAETIDAQSLAIANQLLQMDLWDYSFYHIFLPIEEQREINTEYILHILSGKDKNIVVSKSNFKTCRMQHYLLTDSTTLVKNKFHIPEPVDGIQIPSEQIDVIFLPLLAFDTSGNRVGYGKGFYDRFIEKCRPDVIKIGLSFFEAEPEAIEITPGDEKLSACVTPNTVYSF